MYSNMKKYTILILLIFAALISNAADRTLSIRTGYTELRPVSLDASDTTNTSETTTFTIENRQKYAQNQVFTIGLEDVSGTPSVTITAYGKVTSTSSWVAIGSAITWTSDSDDGSITSTSPINYNYLKVEFVASGATQQTLIDVFEVKTSNAYDIPANSGTLTVSRATAGTVTITSADNNADAALTIAAGGTGALTLGDAGSTTAITSSDWAIDATGAMTGIGAITSTGAISGTTITGTGKISTTATTEQLRLNYDATNYATATVAADGALTIATVDAAAAEGDINLNPDGLVGIKTAVPTVELDVTGAIKASGTVSAATYGSDGSITDAELLTLDNGATTEILVGGGAGSAPVWTTATGTGAPVRATSPTLVTPTLGTPSAGILTSCSGLPMTTGVTGVLPVANGGTNALTASITSFNNITGYTASGATGTTSTNLVFSTSPTFTTSIDLSDGNITNVGNIELDSIKADGSAIAIGAGTETVAINTSDWDIGVTGIATGLGDITSDGKILTTDTIVAATMLSDVYDVDGASGVVIGSDDVLSIQLLGQSEDLVLTPSADTWTATSSTGVTSVDYGTINLATDALDLSDGDIANVGSIALDALTADGTNITVSDPLLIDTVGSVGSWGYTGEHIVLPETSSNTNAGLGIYSMVDYSATAGKVFAGTYSRALAMTTNQTNQSTIVGSESQFRLRDVNIADGVHAGLWAYAEQSGTSVLSGNGTFDAISAAIESEAGFSVGATEHVTGITIDGSINAGATINASANFSGLYIKSNGLDWFDGIKITGCDNDIKLQNGEVINNATDGVTNLGNSNIRGATWNFCDAAGVGGTAASAVALDYTPDLPALQAGLMIMFVAEGANTTTLTIAVDGGTAKNVYEQAPGAAPSALEGSEINTGSVVMAVYDGTQWVLVSPAGN